MAETLRLPGWEELPDFGLYMDQLLTYADRTVPGEITAGMINSYVKSGLLARPERKKYARESLAQLLMVGLLKPVLPLESLRQLLHPASGADTRNLYEALRAGLEKREQAPPPEESALDCALEAALYQRACRRMLEETDKEADAPCNSAKE